MKKLQNLILLPALLLALLLCSSAQAAEPVDTHTASLPTSARVLGDTLYAIADGRIIALASPESGAETVVNLADFPEIDPSEWDYLWLTGDGDALYLLQPRKGLLYRVEPNALTLAMRLDISSLGRETLTPGERYVMFCHPVLMDGRLYLLSMDTVAWQGYELYGFSLDTGECSSVEIGLMEPEGLVPYRDGMLLTVNRDDESVVALKPDGSGRTEVLARLPAVNNRHAVYHPAEDAVYFLSGFTLMRYRGGFEQAENLPFDDMSFTAWAGVWHGELVALTSQGLYRCAKGQTQPVQPDKNALRIWSNSNLLTSDDLIGFRASHPEISLEVQVGAQEDPMERLMNESLSRDASIDIFILSSYMIDSQLIFERGFAAPIRSDRLQRNMYAMLPQIGELLTRDGALYGYPMALWPDFWTVRPDLLEAAGWSEPPRTMEAYVDMLLDWYDAHADERQTVTFNGCGSVRMQQVNTAQMLLNAYVYAYASGDAPVAFNTPAFAQLLKKLELLSEYEGTELDLMDAAEAGALPRIFHTGKSVTPLSRAVNPANWGEVTIDVPVFFEVDAPTNGASMDYFILNPNSQHQEEAIAFLEYYSQHLDPKDAYLLAPDQAEPVLNDQYQEQIEALQSRADQLTESIRQQEASVGVITELLEGMQVSAEDNAALQAELTAAQKMLTAYSDELAECEASLSLAETSRYIISPEVIAEYQAVAQGLSLRNHHWAWEIMEELDTQALFTRYFEGGASLEQTLRELDQRVAMMFYEGQ